MNFFKFASRHLTLLSAVGLFVMSSLFFSIVYGSQPTVLENKVDINTKDLSSLPVLLEDNYPLLTAQNVFALDLGSSVVLYEKNPDEKVYPASTTKIATALVALDYYRLDEVINTGQFASIGSRMGLVWNENIEFEDLLYGLLIHSGNDAAEVLANSYEGGREEFIRDMNAKAKSLYAQNTNFVNPSGLDEEGQYTTARDLVRLAAAAMKNETFAKIVATSDWLAVSSDGVIKHKLNNRNELLGSVEGVLGVKTGYTLGARENLVTFVERDGKKIVIALLGSQDRFRESEKLIDWIFSSYKWVEPTDLDSFLL